MKMKIIPPKQTNKFYGKTKFVSTHPEGQIMPLPDQSGRDIALSALSELPLAQGTSKLSKSIQGIISACECYGSHGAPSIDIAAPIPVHNIRCNNGLEWASWND